MSSEINPIQARILRTLLVNGRKSAAEIAEKIGVAKEVVQQNYMKMKRDGIIEGATIHFNYRGFGYFAVAYMLIIVEPTQADQMIEYVRRMPDIYSVYKCGPEGNLRVVATLKSLKQLDEIKDTFKQRFSITSLKTVIWTDVKEMHENLLLAPIEGRLKGREDENSRNHVFSKRSKTKVEFDQVDLKIVDALSADGLAPFSKIAEKIGVSSNTVKKHYENLTKSGLIKVTIQIDPSKIGYNALAVFFVTFMLQIDSLSVIKRISQIPDVISIMKTSGDYDLQVYVMIRDINQLLEVQEEFAEIPGITKVEMDINRVLNKWPTPRQYISTF
jgi:DNA-binding Lrp family transcriptional regulator